MKKLKHLLLLVTVILSTQQISAMPAQTSITVNQCFTTEEAVFLLVGTRWLGAEAVNFTTDGIFVLEEGDWLSIEEAIEYDTFWTWTCRKCGTTNVQGVSTCRNCGES